MGNAAQDSFFNHLWYLCPELVTMVLFDKDVRIAEKSAIAQALLQHLYILPQVNQEDANLIR